jgi:multiple sugar transport system permease protein
MSRLSRDRERSRRVREDLRALPYLVPWILGVLLFFLYPLAATVYFSFTRYDQINPPEFVGLRNWIYVFTQYRPFYQAMGNTFWLVLLMVPASTLFGMVTGAVVMRIKRGAGIFRTLFYLPFLAPPVAATLAFVFLLSPTGPVNQLFARIGIAGPSWFNDPATSKLALTILGLWGIGNLMVIFLASLLDVPREQYEAASLDGAGPLARLWYVTLPAIKPIILFSIVTGVIQTLQYYTQAVVAGKVASGESTGPGASFVLGYPNGSTLTLPQLIYSLGFQNFDTGSASVVSVVLMIFALGFTTILLRRGSAFLGEGD